MLPETSEQAQVETIARAVVLMLDKSVDNRRRVEQLESALKAMSLENDRLRAKCQRFEVADLERRRFEEEG